MNLTTKASLIVGGMLLALSGTVVFVADKVLYKGFVDLERQSAQDDANRGINALQGVANRLSMYGRDYATWDDTVNYLDGSNDSFVEENLDPEYQAGQNTNYVGIFRLDGEPVYTTGYTSDGTPDDQLTAAVDAFVRDNPAFLETTSRGEHSLTVVLTPAGPMMIAASPVRTTDENGGPYGCYVVGRLITDEFIEELSDSIQVRVDVWSPDDPARSADLAEAQPVLTTATPVRIDTVDDKHLNVLMAFKDSEDRPVLLLSAEVPRLITAQGRALIRSSILLFLPGAVLVTGIVMFVMQRTILRPLVRLTEHVESIGASATVDLQPIPPTKRTDEIGRLTHEFNHMLVRLSEIQAELIETSRFAGMADVATGVLHNVGNVLNSVNVSANLLSQRVRESKVSYFQKTAELLNEHAGSLGEFLEHDERGKQLPRFLLKLGEFLREEQQNSLKDLKDLAENIEHINQIVNMQQRYAKVAGVVERVECRELVDDAVRINEAALERHGVRVERRFLRPQATLHVDRHKVMQILVNLISNAKYALDDMPPDGRVITFEVDVDDAAGMAEIRVIDRGVGIDPQNLSRIFEQGFTTRSQGHGFGLHTSCLAAQELGGSLTAHSDGPGCGATFTLRVPLHPSQKPVGAAT